MGNNGVGSGGRSLLNSYYFFVFFSIPGAQLATKESSIKVVKAICEKAGIEFTESLLTWKATDDALDPNWVVPGPSANANMTQGFYARANTSTGFEDSKERFVDMEKMAEEDAQMAEDIKACKLIFQKIISLPYTLKL